MIPWPDPGFPYEWAQFVIYDGPLDYPDHWVVRRHFFVRGSTDLRIDVFHQIASSLEEARALIPPGFFRIERHPSDDPVIAETWL